MSFYVVDVESDGPIPGKYSMVSFGAVLVEPGLRRTFYGRTRPISERWLPEALAISGATREEHLRYDEPGPVMEAFEGWVEATTRGRPVFFSDNLAFDWQFMNWYFHTYLERNPFGWSGRRIGDLYCGLVRDAYAAWKHLRTTGHDHHPVNDARGNAEVLLKLAELGLQITFR
jgi:hypothetical protein